MILITEWWGLQLIPETVKDDELLAELHSEIGDNASEYYEDGSVSRHGENNGFSTLEIHR